MSEVSPPPRNHPSKPSFKGRVVRKIGWLAFVGGGVLTPRIAAKAAATLWCKLPGNPGRRKDNRPYPGRIERVDVGLTSPLTVEIWGDDGPLVYLVHGWGGWRGQVASFVEPLVEAGARVIAFDALSCGDSGPGEHGPTHSSGGELISSLEAIADRYGNEPLGVIAHSLGCGAACRAIVDGKLTTRHLTLVSPNPDMRIVARRYGESLGFRPRTIQLMMDAMERWAHRRLDEFDVAEMGSTGELPDALVIHDQADKESPYQVAQQIDQRWPGAHLMTTHGLGHHRILINGPVIQAATTNIITEGHGAPRP